MVLAYVVWVFSPVKSHYQIEVALFYCLGGRGGVEVCVIIKVGSSHCKVLEAGTWCSSFEYLLTAMNQAWRLMCTLML